MKAKQYAIPPEGCNDYLTPGKRYEITWESDTTFHIEGEGVGSCFCLKIGCGHLKGQDWTIVTEDTP